ncbi:MAG: efflux RND transporter periplasmic adaptor subunit [Deltaproteobacteria bacterium]|nr:efflux RND transporter periplasmic adaptor subunit [Deltaproteobacteria bacterium]
MSDIKIKRRLAAAAIIISITAALVYVFYAMKPATKKRRPKPVVPIVEVLNISPSTESVYIEAAGEVIPAMEANLFAEVEGKIIDISSELVPGGIVKKGDKLVSIDRADYILRVKELKAGLAEAESQLELEEGQQVVAREEWRLFEKEHAAAQADKSLALREPHLKSAKARLDAARSRLAAAELDLKRTTVVAPFNGIILEEFAEKGQYVGRQGKIATLAGTDYFWVRVSIPLGYVSRIAFPDKKNKSGAEVKVILDTSNGKKVIRSGNVEKLLGDLDLKGRMARILVRIDDPLALGDKAGDGRILIGSFVKLQIDAGKLENIYALPREVVHEGDRLFIFKKDNTLDVRKLDIQWRRKNELLGLVKMDEGERLIVSRLQNALPGMKLRAAGDKVVGDKVGKAEGKGKE